MTCTVWCGVVVKKRSRFLDGIGAFLYGVYEMRRKNRISLLLAGAFSRQGSRMIELVSAEVP